MCLPEISEDDSGNYEVCCGGLHSYVASVFFCVIDFWSMFSMFFVIAFLHYEDNPLRWQVTVPLSLLYVAFIFYLSGPIGLYTGHGTLLKVYYYRVIVMFLFATACMITNIRERQNLIFSILWFFTAITYFAGFYVHGKTLKFFRTRWNGYDDGDLVLATKLRAQGLPVAVYNMREYFTFFKLEHESESQLQKEQRAATGAMKSSGKSAKLNSGNSVTG